MHEMRQPELLDPDRVTSDDRDNMTMMEHRNRAQQLDEALHASCEYGVELWKHLDAVRSYLYTSLPSDPRAPGPQPRASAAPTGPDDDEGWRNWIADVLRGDVDPRRAARRLRARPQRGQSRGAAAAHSAEPETARGHRLRRAGRRRDGRRRRLRRRHRRRRSDSPRHGPLPPVRCARLRSACCSRSRSAVSCRDARRHDRLPRRRRPDPRR